MTNVININKNAPDTRPIEDLSPEEVNARAKSSMLALKQAMDTDNVAGALAALASYSERIDLMSYLGVKEILSRGMPSCGRVCYNPTLGWYDKADHPEAD